MSPRIREFLDQVRPETPCLVVDLGIIEARFRELSKSLPWASLYYAMKANPAMPVLSRLETLGSGFDAASFSEIDKCLKAGISPDRIMFGNTVKIARDVARAYERGIRLFACDSRAEMKKIALEAPGAEVFCRIFMEGVGADWPLSRKFGCSVDMAVEILTEAAEQDLCPVGVSFHVGSQQRCPERWRVGVCRAAQVFERLQKTGHDLSLLNIGGGFPAHYREDVAALSTYGTTIRSALDHYFGTGMPKIVAEPGRGIVGDAGVIVSEVILVAEKSREPDRRWVFLDIGKFGGLAETFEEAICYRIKTSCDGGAVGPVVLAGPTCDEVDVLYDKAGYELPVSLAEGDRVEFHGAGAYTSTYASVGFNGYWPPREFYL